jgi:hypothetical protein
MHFRAKNTLKHNLYHTPEQALGILDVGHRNNHKHCCQSVAGSTFSCFNVTLAAVLHNSIP